MTNIDQCKLVYNSLNQYYLDSKKAKTDFLRPIQFRAVQAEKIKELQKETGLPFSKIVKTIIDKTFK